MEMQIEFKTLFEKNGLNFETDVFTTRDRIFRYTAWHMAVEDGKVDVLEDLWKQSKEFNLKDEFFENHDGKDIWSLALQHGKLQILRKVYEISEEIKLNFIDVVLLDANNERKLIWYDSLNYENTDVLDWLQELFNSEKLNELKLTQLLDSEEGSDSVWHNAVENGTVELLEKLLTLTKETQLSLKDVTLLKKNTYEQTIWNRAIFSGKPDVIEWLWKLAGDLLEKDLLTIEERKSLFLEPDKNGDTVWHIGACTNAKTLETLWQFGEVVGLNRIEDIFTKEGCHKRTVWHIVVLDDSLATLNKLLDLVESQLTTDQIKTLLSRQDTDGRTVWHLAANRNYISVLETLWTMAEKKGIDIKNELLSVKDKREETIWHQASKNDNTTFLELIWKKAQNLNAEFSKTLMEDPAEGNKTALHLAAREGKFETTNFLIRNGANISARNNGTVLHQAILSKNVLVIKLILDEIQAKSNGSEELLNAEDNYGYTALMRAIEIGETEIVKILLSTNGIDVNLKNERISSALNLASKKKNWNMVVMLLNSKADIKDLKAEECNSLITYIKNEFKNNNMEHILIKIYDHLARLNLN